MNDPKRLGDLGGLGDLGDLGSKLLASAKDDAPSPAARARAAAAIGVGVGAAATAATTKAAAAATTKGAAGAATANVGTTATTATLKLAGAGLWTKVIAVGAVTALVGSGAIIARESRDTTAPVVTRVGANAVENANTPAAAPFAPARSRADEIPAPEPLNAPTDMAAITASSIAPSTAGVNDTGATPRSGAGANANSTRGMAANGAGAGANGAGVGANANGGAPISLAANGRGTNANASRSASANGGAAGPSALTREVRAIDVARAALDRGDAGGALAALDQHDRDFPAGPLRTEADVLRVDALVARGNRAAAKALAQQLLARDPASAHAKHLRSVVGEAEK